MNLHNVRIIWLKAILQPIGILIVAYLFSVLLFKVNFRHMYWIDLLGSVPFLWVIHGSISYKIQTWAGESPAEKFDRRAVRILTSLRYFLVFVSIFLKKFWG